MNTCYKNVKMNLDLVGKRRKETKGFPGADLILEEIKNKPAKRRVGFLSTGPPARGELLFCVHVYIWCMVY